LSDFLYGCQFNKGDVACIVSPNCSQYAIIFGAIATCGGILSGVNDLFVLDEIRAQIIDSGASALFCHESVLEKVRNVRDRYKKIKVCLLRYIF
jgi:4-coumarate--CoA ligase